MKTAPMKHTQINSCSGQMKHLITLLSLYTRYPHWRNFYTWLTSSICHTCRVSEFPVLSTDYILFY